MVRVGNKLRYIEMAGLILVAAAIFAVPATAQDAAGNYKAKCAACHAADGKGDTPAGKKMGARDFTSPEVQKESDSDLAQAIAKGKKKMPSYEGKLKPEEIKALVAYIRELGKGK